MSVVALHQDAGERLLTKKELAAELHRSERWIELRQHDGLPVAETDRFGRRRYSLAEVQEWLLKASKPRTAGERIADLERQVVRLSRIVDQLTGAGR